jgi:2,3-bisphosphoglycerate-independent phosphoglycerate mutase
MREDKYKFVLVNFANPDMVGHTGNIEASIQAIKTVDTCVSRIVDEAFNHNYTVLITADHGNAEQKINPQTGEISTEHTANPVPFIAINSHLQGRYIKLQPGILADVAPTVLSVIGIPIPESMSGRNLLEGINF